MPKVKEHIIPITMEQDEEDSEPENVASSVEKLSLSQITEPDQEEKEQLIERDPIVVNGNFEIPKRSLPLCNVEEHILFVIDPAEDEKSTSFKLSNNKSLQPLAAIKQSIEIFIYNKHIINPKHMFAIVVLNENSCSWLLDFTNNIQQLTKVLSQISTCDTEDIFDLNTLFQVICEKANIPTISNDLMLPPPYILRTVLLYGRSYTIPKFKKNDELINLLNNPYFTLDIIMTHEPVSSSNNCVKIFQVLQNLDKKGFAYFFPVARNLRTLHSSMAKLLSHPLQRPIQKSTNYVLKNKN